MIQIILYTFSMIMSIIFMQMKHPLAMGMMLLIQTFLISMIMGIISKTFWFSYILFLIFLGGMLVLFIYVTSLASNEMFSFSMKSYFFSILILMISIILTIFIDPMFLKSLIMNNEMMSITMLNSFIQENTLNLNKLYNFPTNIITILMMNYLFLTLIAAVKITNVFYGPLRPSN
uniref:NADH-ubiquinone oxidoreductase chain 6 n=1 Tax=Ptychoptera qinggouensis TaxID=2785440 RepID=A0A873HMJ9_9DIPT|nr:NADH dehydrogenase subunit 6 [Ptychoptera qinggouensis]QOZ38540.1 NADH dehydrogenase subunit 6 [Ptychoptera qinggouensis]